MYCYFYSDIMILAQEIKFVVSAIVSDDTGQLMRLIQSLTILIGLLITLLKIIVPVLEWLQDSLVSLQLLKDEFKPRWGYAPG